MRSRFAVTFATFFLATACVTTINPFDDGLNAPDRDGDGFGDALQGGADCDDSNAQINPDAAEVCEDGLDNNCDGTVDDVGEGSITWYQDLDRDTYGDPDVRTQACPGALVGDGFSTDNTDCDDSLASVNPGVEVDVCNALDDDCDAEIDEDEVATFNGTSYPAVEDAIVRAAASNSSAIVEVCGQATPHLLPPQRVEGTADITVRANPLGDTAVLSQAEGSEVFRVTQGARLVLQDIVIEGSVAAPALIAEDGSQLNLIGAVLRSNPSGGLRIDGRKAKVDVVVVNSIFRGNGKSSNPGGAIVAEGAFDLDMQDCTIAENAGSSGAGVYAAGSGATSSIHLSGCSVEQNEAVGTGGGMYVSDVANVEFSKTSVIDNSADDGAGLALFDATVLADSASVISENVAVSAGGGLFLRDVDLTGFVVETNSAATGGGVYVNDTSIPSDNSIDSTTVRNNSATDGAGVAVAFDEASSLQTAACAIEDNMATGSGGGVFVDFATGRGGALQVEQSTFLRNFPVAIELGVGVTCEQPSTPSDFTCSWIGCTVCQ